MIVHLLSKGHPTLLDEISKGHPTLLDEYVFPFILNKYFNLPPPPPSSSPQVWYATDTFQAFLSRLTLRNLFRNILTILAFS